MVRMSLSNRLSAFRAHALEAAHAVLERFAPDLSREDVEFARRYQGIYTMTSLERLVALRDAVRYLTKAGIPGAIVECGVWRGGSMMAAAETLLACNSANRELYLYDTFSGMTAPTVHDTDAVGVPAQAYASAYLRRGESWCEATEEEVSVNLRSTGYPPALVKLVPGNVEETLPAHAPPQIALLRLDTDFYESTRHELVTLYPRLAPGGVLIIDDYGYWSGARRAADEYFGHSNNAILLTRLDWTARLGIKLR